MPPADHSQRTFNIQGTRLGYPAEFRDGYSILGMYLVPVKVADGLIANSGFTCARVLPRRTLLNLICVHYTETDCGSYEEIALAFPVNPHGTAKRTWLANLRALRAGCLPSYTWRLPVTTPAAHDCGVFMWGYPKTIESIDREIIDGEARFTWHEGGETILKFSLPAQGNKTPPPISPPVYSIFEGRPHVGHLSQSYRDVGYFFRGGDLILGNHALADDLRRLGLPRKSLMAIYNGHLNFRMSAPVPL